MCIYCFILLCKSFTFIYTSDIHYPNLKPFASLKLTIHPRARHFNIPGTPFPIRSKNTKYVT